VFIQFGSDGIPSYRQHRVLANAHFTNGTWSDERKRQEGARTSSLHDSTIVRKDSRRAILHGTVVCVGCQKVLWILLHGSICMF